jgi:hypothetical protein
MTNAMSHEPRGFVGNIERAVELVTADAFLRLAQQESREPPFRQWNFRALENCTDGDGELTLAVVAVEQARTMRLLLAFDARDRAGTIASHLFGVHWRLVRWRE